MSIASILRTQKPRVLNADEEKLKRDLYEKISPRRRKFIDRIGYENWTPSPSPMSRTTSAPTSRSVPSSSSSRNL